MKIKDIIYREDAIKALHEEWDGGWMEVTGEWVADNCEAVLNKLPFADRPQGEWIYTINPLRLNDEWECSKCGYLSFTKTNYCGHCGCRMKGADDE